MESQKITGTIYTTEIIDALLSNISDLYLLDMASGKVTAYRANGNAIGVADGLGMDMCYEALMEIYISNNVFEQDRDAMRSVVVLEDIVKRLREVDRFIYHYRVRRNDYVQYFFMKVIRMGEPDDIRGIIFSFTPENNDVNREKLIDIIEVDELTGVYTKQAFCHYAEKLLSDNPDKVYNIVVADIANFRLINAVYGEDRGDAVLRYVAEYLKKISRSGVLGRFSADSFIGIDEDLGDAGNKAHMAKLIDDFKKKMPVSNLAVKFGAYLNVDRSLSVSAMCDRAVLAVRSIQGNHEFSYARYDGPVSMAHMKSQNYEARFEEALENGEFKVWYQPKYDAVSEKIVGAEALVRWIGNDGAIVSPGEFIPVFESDGYIVNLDEYVFKSVCNTIKELKEEGYSLLPVSVNLSRASLYADDTAMRYRKIMDEAGLNPNDVPIEITESTEIANERILERMNRLKDKGFKVHMDDFGSGLSSLASINKFPFDAIKLDKTLVDGIGDPGGDELLRHTIELAHFKHMLVVAEGVEEKEQLETLRKLGSDTIQGFYFSPPKPLDEFRKIINN